MIPVMDELESTGEWEKATASINTILLDSCTGKENDDVEISFAVNYVDGNGPLSYSWTGRRAGSDDAPMIVFAATYELDKLPEKVAAEEGEEGAEEDDDNRGKGKGKEREDDPNPRDPRKRVPKEREVPDNPGNPG